MVGMNALHSLHFPEVFVFVDILEGPMCPMGSENCAVILELDKRSSVFLKHFVL